MKVPGCPRQAPGLLPGFLRLLWMLPAVCAVEGKPAVSGGTGGPVLVQNSQRRQRPGGLRGTCAEGARRSADAALSWKRLRFSLCLTSSGAPADSSRPARPPVRLLVDRCGPVQHVRPAGCGTSTCRRPRSSASVWRLHLWNQRSSERVLLVSGL